MNSNPIIIDANVVVKWFVEENDSGEALKLRDKFIIGEIDLIVPHLLFFEVLNALKYSDLFTQAELNDICVSLENYGLNIKTIKDEVREKMIEIALKHDLSIYDAAYVALALKFKGLLFTADEKIIKKLPKRVLSHVKSLTQINEILVK
jgi:predicted nucleic acid-binding protein